MKELIEELSKPFAFEDHKWRVMNMSKKKDKASVAFYIDARDAMDRLDESGATWSDNYQVLEHGPKTWHVECTLIVDGVVRTDVGEGDDPKSAYSDALKRAAVKFGVFRYGYGFDTKAVNFGWFPVDQYGAFSADSNQKIENMLKEQLAKMGAPVAERPTVAQKEPPPEPEQIDEESIENMFDEPSEKDTIIKHIEDRAKLVYEKHGAKLAEISLSLTNDKSSKLKDVSLDNLKVILTGLEKLPLLPANEPEDLPTADEIGRQVADTISTWEFVKDAEEWAVAMGHCENIHQAKNSWKNVVKDAGGFKPAKLPQLFASFAHKHIERQAMEGMSDE